MLDSRKRSYAPLRKNSELAELIGIILGDGHIQTFPRTERIVITCGGNKIKYVNRIAKITTNVFDKIPSILNHGKTAVDISIYQCKLSSRLGIPPGNKIRNNVGVPGWIKKNREFMMSCLKGLFETDGCFQEDISNYAQYIELKNFCSQIKIDTYQMLKALGYNPQMGKCYVRLAKKKEAYSFKKLISFRKY